MSASLFNSISTRIVLKPVLLVECQIAVVETGARLNLERN
jgi:hypothetical protein